jgi:hypothetical protein
MAEVLVPIAIIAAYLVLVRWVFPKLGVPT